MHPPDECALYCSGPSAMAVLFAWHGKSSPAFPYGSVRLRTSGGNMLGAACIRVEGETLI
jgi:hypothetical protein